jgi:Peptidase family S41
MSPADARFAVETTIGKRVKISDYRTTITPLSPTERTKLIDQAVAMLERIYAHLPLKRALHANDPIQLLRLLRLRQGALDERAFQSALMEIFLGLRDLHTNYILPTIYAQNFAFLPFRIEEFYEPSGVLTPDDPTPPRKYVVSWVSPINTVGNLKEGVEVTHWNGSPIELAVARNGNREAGSNLDARRAQGIEALTLRWLGISLPPDEDWVNLTYTNGTTTYNSRFDWEIIDSSDRPELLAGLTEVSDRVQTIGLDLKRVLLDRARTLIFDPQAVQVQKEAAAHVERAGASTPPRADTSSFPDVFPRFGKVSTPSGDFGYIRLRSFAPAGGDVGGAVAEFARILGTLPQTGLILDVRGNGGGYINFGELILQMLTPGEISPEPFHFLATPLALDIASDPQNGLQAWKETIAQGLESGASFSQGFPLTDPKECNSIGQIYQGPVVLVTDALCYSTTDIFAAGFQDHQIGKILGCHSSTGAGGANVWDYEYLSGVNVPGGKNPFDGLPGGAEMRVAARRCTRVGQRSGIPVEDYGIVSDDRYFMSKKDVVNNNDDLIAAAAGILKKRQNRSLQLAVDAKTQKTLAVTYTDIDRIDLSVDGRPVLSQDTTVSQSEQKLQLSFPLTPNSRIRADGYRDGTLVVSTRLSIDP